MCTFFLVDVCIFSLRIRTQHMYILNKILQHWWNSIHTVIIINFIMNTNNIPLRISTKNCNQFQVYTNRSDNEDDVMFEPLQNHIPCVVVCYTHVFYCKIEWLLLLFRNMALLLLVYSILLSGLKKLIDAK